MSKIWNVLRHLERLEKEWGETPAILAEAGVFLDYARVRAVFDARDKEADIMRASLSTSAEATDRHARLYFCFTDVASRIAEMKMLLQILESQADEGGGG